MTTAEALVPRRVARNWAAVLIFIVGVVGVFALLVHAVFEYNAVIGSAANILIILFSYFPGMIAILVAAFALAFGSARFVDIVGRSRWGRVALVAWGLLNAASEFAFIGYVTSYAPDLARAQNVQLTIAIAAAIVGLVAAFFVLRAHVVTGFGRVGLFVAILLFAVSEVMTMTGAADTGGWWDTPRMAGLAILGLGYWRAGVIPTAAATAE